MSLDGNVQGDIGLRVCALIYEKLMIDDEWSHAFERGFGWVGHRLVQRVWASPPEDSEGKVISLISARTTVVENVSLDEQKAIGCLAAFNYAAVGSAYVYDVQTRSVDLCLAYVIHEEMLRDRTDELAANAILQLCEAEDNADALAATLKGDVASRGHPQHGPRQAPDGMLDVVRQVFIPQGSEVSRFINIDEMKRVEALFHGTACASLGAWAEGVTVEVACGPDMTTLIELRADVPHPWLGSGLAVRTTLPLPVPSDEIDRFIARLQELQLATNDGGGQCGAWYVGHHRQVPYPTWTRFIPNALFRPRLAADVTMSEVVRALWVDRLFYPGLPLRSAWPIMRARYEAQSQAN
jgi:hypothetical protein